MKNFQIFLFSNPIQKSLCLLQYKCSHSFYVLRKNLFSSKNYNLNLSQSQYLLDDLYFLNHYNPVTKYERLLR